MISNELPEKTCFLRANKLRDSWSNSSSSGSSGVGVGNSLTRNNAVHVAGTFQKGATLYDVDQAVSTLMQELARHLGIGQYGLSRLGVVLMRPCPHVHMIVRSIKSSKTGLTCSRLPGHALDAIKATWKKQTGETVYIRPIYNVKRLIGYISGNKNVMRPGQVWMEIPPHNLERLERKAA